MLLPPVFIIYLLFHINTLYKWDKIQAYCLSISVCLHRSNPSPNPWNRPSQQKDVPLSLHYSQSLGVSAVSSSTLSDISISWTQFMLKPTRHLLLSVRSSKITTYLKMCTLGTHLKKDQFPT